MESTRPTKPAQTMFRNQNLAVKSGKVDRITNYVVNARSRIPSRSGSHFLVLAG
jgi:hypothetical protein